MVEIKNSNAILRGDGNVAGQIRLRDEFPFSWILENTVRSCQSGDNDIYCTIVVVVGADCANADPMIAAQVT